MLCGVNVSRERVTNGRLDALINRPTAQSSNIEVSRYTQDRRILFNMGAFLFFAAMVILAVCVMRIPQH